MRRWTQVVVGCLGCVCTLACAARPQTNEPSASDPVVSKAFSLSRTDKVDLLFVVDNSNSMAGEQAQLRAQFPRLMEALTSGLRSPDDPRPFTPVRDLHVGVVSTDMGIPGVELPPSCHADGGDDGKLRRRPPDDQECASEYPPFLSYEEGSSDPAQLIRDFACVANLGTGGCGFEQPLEAALKALSPRVVLGADAQPTDTLPLRFLASETSRTYGRGDLPIERGGNLGFLRNDPSDPSLLAVVVLTDEEDCSVTDTRHLRPNNQVPEGDPLRSEDINLRCFNHPEFNHNVRGRYLEGLRALRPGREDLVVFSAIVGVPPDLVSADVLTNTDLTDDSSRAVFYEAILTDPRMQEEVDQATAAGTGTGNLRPSCVRPHAGGEVSTAYPPRRIVELAREFGANGMVQSICQDDFGPAIDMLVHSMAKPLSEMCMSQRLRRDDTARVRCQLFWDLPTAEEARTQGFDPEAPTQCAQLQGLHDERVPVELGPTGGQRCAIHQLPVRDGEVAADSEGWYYDDFTPNLDTICAQGLQRIAFSQGALPPRGVAVQLDCEAGAQQPL